MQKLSNIIDQHKNQASLSQRIDKKNSLPFFQSLVQPKLTINQPNDIYEQEADAVADKIMRMSVQHNEQSFFQPQPIFVARVQRKCAPCEEGEKLVQMKSGLDMIQRQDDEDEQKVPATSVVGQENDWDKKFQLKLPEWGQLDNAAVNKSLHLRGVPRPEDYAGDSETEFDRQVDFYKRFGWGKAMRNLNKIPVLKLVIPDLEGDDPDVGLANKTAPISVGSALKKEYPTLEEEKNDGTIIIPLREWKF